MAIMVVHTVGALFNAVVVVVCGCLILWVLVALIIGMLAVGAMQMAQPFNLTVLGGGPCNPHESPCSRSNELQSSNYHHSK
jgi:hypothetical protein